jgi:hypothetical protein
VGQQIITRRRRIALARHPPTCTQDTLLSSSRSLAARAIFSTAPVIFITFIGTVMFTVP